MKSNKILLISAVIFIIILCTQTVFAASNDFTAKLSVSDTSVPAGTVVTSTISITNTDTTYGADVAVSYSGQNILSFYLGAGETKNIYNDVTITQQTDIYYTVYASHGPDISKTKNTNTVTVYIENPATNTPKPTETATQKPTEIVTITPTITETYTPKPTETETTAPTEIVTIAPETTQVPTHTPVVYNDEGWSGFMSAFQHEETVLDNLFKESIGTWLGLNSTEDLGEENEYMQELYKMRKMLAAAFVLLVFSIIVYIVIVFIGSKK